MSGREIARLAVLVALAAGPVPAVAQPGAAPRPPPADTPAALLDAANAALAAGDPAAAARLAERARGAATAADRAEALRVLGLARFLLGDRPAAEAAFVELLVLDADAGLDPALVSPEAIVYFEDVRARHAPDLASRRPKPRRRRYPWLAPLPVASQLQNEDRTKAWIIGGAGLALLAVNVGSYAWLRRHCDERDGTCHDGPAEPLAEGHVDLTERARDVQTLNILSGAALAGVAIYAVVDGVLGYRADSRALEIQVSASGRGDLAVSLGSTF